MRFLLASLLCLPTLAIAAGTDLPTPPAPAPAPAPAQAAPPLVCLTMKEANDIILAAAQRDVGAAMMLLKLQALQSPAR